MQESLDLHGLRFTSTRHGATHQVTVTRLANQTHRGTFTGTGNLHRDADRWMADQLDATPPPPVHCTRCNTELNSLDSSATQPADALPITFHGGYGMYIDTIDGEPTALLCTDCADQLCDTNPWLDQLLHPERHDPDT